jgi:hypothetical protein
MLLQEVRQSPYGTAVFSVKIVIPSHKRAERVRTTKVVSCAILCVPKSQEADYRRHNPGVEIEAHPDQVIGLARKRNWIYEKFGSVMMLDDDLTRFSRLYLEAGSLRTSRITPDETYQIIQRTAETARALGAYLFGFSSVADARNYKPQRPFRLTGYCNGSSFGLLKGSRIFFHEGAVAVEDYFGSLINAYYHRYAFFDLRFGFVQERTFKNIGGQSEFRSMKSEEGDYKFLKKMFGDALEQRPATERGRPSHQWQRVVKLPF